VNTPGASSSHTPGANDWPNAGLSLGPKPSTAELADPTSPFPASVFRSDPPSCSRRGETYSSPRSLSTPAAAAGSTLRIRSPTTSPASILTITFLPLISTTRDLRSDYPRSDSTISTVSGRYKSVESPLLKSGSHACSREPQWVPGGGDSRSGDR